MKAELIVALDVERTQDAQRLVKKLHPPVSLFKIGSQLFTAAGPLSVEMVQRAGAGVFLDLKYHDIPNTVAEAVRQATRLGVSMLTLHTAGGRAMLEAAGAAARTEAKAIGVKKPQVVGVTVLTSDASSDAAKMVVERALLAKDAGLDGVVCSVHEAAAVRSACGKDFIIVTPGIRLPGGEAGDQKRIATPTDAAAAGSDFIVVGRPIVEAADPRAVAEAILKSLGA